MGAATGNGNSKLGGLDLLRALTGMLGSAGRGVATATAGMPGDLVRLGHHVGNAAAGLVGLPENPPLPPGATYGSDYMRRVMPNLPMNMRSSVYEQLGSQMPLTPGQIGKVAASPVGMAGLGALAGDVSMAGLPMMVGAIKNAGGRAPAFLSAEADPLVQAMAARMIGQLNAVPDAVPGLSALRGVNLPAAYAGDMRSLKAAQGKINEAETGLASPGRRKMLQQIAATTARSAIPDTLVDGLGANLLNKVASKVAGDAVTSGSTEIPIESIQAAISQAFGGLLSDKKAVRKLQKFLTKNSIDSFDKDEGVAAALRALDPDVIAERSGLPADVIKQYIGGEDKLRLRRSVERWIAADGEADAFFDESGRGQWSDYFGLDVNDEETVKAMEDIRQRLNAGKYGNPDTPDHDMYGQAHDEIIDIVAGAHRKGWSKADEQLFGSNLDGLEKLGVGRSGRQQFEQLWDGMDDSAYDAIANDVQYFLEPHI